SRNGHSLVRGRVYAVHADERRTAADRAAAGDRSAGRARGKGREPANVGDGGVSVPRQATRGLAGTLIPSRSSSGTPEPAQRMGGLLIGLWLDMTAADAVKSAFSANSLPPSEGGRTGAAVGLRIDVCH